MKENCVKCKWIFLCGNGEKSDCTFERKSEYQQLDKMTSKEKEIEHIWLEKQVRRMLEDE